MNRKLKSILHFVLPALHVRELKKEIEYYEDQVVQLSNTIGELRGLVDRAPSFVEVALRDDKLGAEIAEAVKDEAVAKLAPALSREYAKMVSNIAFMGPPPGDGIPPPAGSVLSAMDMASKVYHVRIELPQLNYDMQIAGSR